MRELRRKTREAKSMGRALLAKEQQAQSWGWNPEASGAAADGVGREAGGARSLGQVISRG